MLKPLTQIVHVLGQFGVLAFEALKGGRKRTQPAGFDQ